MYLLIENEGVCPVESFTMFGVTSSRGDDDKIGQFGSGAKHASLLCLRFRIKPIIFLGNSELSFWTTPKEIKGKVHDVVHYSFDGKESQLSYVLDFGGLDWTNIGMALREYISNAIDNGNGNWSVRSVEKIEPSETKTQIYLPMTREITDYYNNRSKYFLHFTNSLKSRFLPNTDKSPCRIYRKGVFVRELETGTPSIFHYNFGEELDINECRNLSDEQVEREIATAICTNEVALRTMFRVLANEDINVYEKNLNYIYISGDRTWPIIWKEINGSTVITKLDRGDWIRARLEKRGHKLASVPHGWYSEMFNKNVPTDFTLRLDEETFSCTEIECNPETKRIAQRIHDIVTKLGMTNGKAMPYVKMFASNLNVDGSDRLGFYSSKTKTIWISVENPLSVNTILEELCHHYTGALDNTRSFQEYAFRVAARLLEEKING